MERNQKPLIEQNRRLAERNRILQNEIKRGEQKLCHSQDGFLTLVSKFCLRMVTIYKPIRNYCLQNRNLDGFTYSVYFQRQGCCISSSSAVFFRWIPIGSIDHYLTFSHVVAKVRYILQKNSGWEFEIFWSLSHKVLLPTYAIRFD